jgi:hypothetical protein
LGEEALQGAGLSSAMDSPYAAGRGSAAVEPFFTAGHSTLYSGICLFSIARVPQGPSDPGSRNAQGSATPPCVRGLKVDLPGPQGVLRDCATPPAQSSPRDPLSFGTRQHKSRKTNIPGSQTLRQWGSLPVPPSLRAGGPPQLPPHRPAGGAPRFPAVSFIFI